VNRPENRRRNRLAAAGLAVGAICGMAGSFVDHEVLRHILWMIDGVSIIVGVALLAVEHFRAGNDTVAAGFLVFLAGQALVLSGAAASLEAGNAGFAGGIAVWAAALLMISSTTTFPWWSRVTGAVAAALFIVSAVQIGRGVPIAATSAPLPSAGYPFLVLTFAGWIRTLLAGERAVTSAATGAAA